MRRNLLLITGLFIAIGVMIALVPFVQSMKPSARAIAKLPRIDLSEMKIGEYRIINEHIYPNIYHGDTAGVLVIRKQNGEFDLWDIAFSDDKVAMPDIHWWNSYQSCNNFGPTVSNGKIIEDKPITCHDHEGISEWSKKEWRWSLDGENLGEFTDDLHKTKGIVFTFSKDS